jgi:dihydroorotate dehydrogenase (fumarate)
MSVDIRTTYLGLDLKNPLVLSACPLSLTADALKQAEDAGLGAAVMPSLFEEQIVHEETALSDMQDFGTESFAEALTYFPEPQEYRTGPENYLDTIEKARKSVSIPVIASLNGTSMGGWIRYGKLMQDAGADALELNIYFVATDPEMTSGEIEERYVDLVAAVKESLSIPLAVKIGPFFSGLPHLAMRLVEAGADGLVLFNRYLEPDIDLEELHFKPSLLLSTRDELRLPLRWIAVLRDHVTASLAATSGVHYTEDVIKALLVGADVTMMASVLLQRGVGYVGQMLEELQSWLEENEYESVEQLKGSMSRIRCDDPSALERANYTKALVSYTGRV